jgi:hypothetical protein
MSISSTESARSDDFKIKGMAADPEDGMDYAAWTMSNMVYVQTLQDLNPISGKKEVPVAPAAQRPSKASTEGDTMATASYPIHQRVPYARAAGNMAMPCMELPIKREEYSKDILVWVALAFFRHWFTQKRLAERDIVHKDRQEQSSPVHQRLA